MVYLSEDHFVTAHSSANPVALRVPQGEVVKVKTRDCYSNGLRAEDDPRGEAPCPVNACNPATGAIFVEGAHPGDTLRVEVLSIDLDDYGTMRVSPKFGFMKHKVTRPITRAFRLKDGKASLSGVEIPLEPMIGVIGVAPETGEMDTETPHQHGGNMDTRFIRAGSTLYLPVHHEGALLSMGDVHAQMGDGEMGVCGLECPAEITVRLSVIPGRKEECPVLLYDGVFYTICSAETLEQAGHLAADNMLEFLKKRVDMDPDELVMLMSLVCDLEVSQVVDPLLTARVALRKGIFKDLAF